MLRRLRQPPPPLPAPLLLIAAARCCRHGCAAIAAATVRCFSAADITIFSPVVLDAAASHGVCLLHFH
jgi:hypothetical protein